MSRPLDQVMAKEMSRKEFIAMMGLGVGSIMGFSTIIKLFTGKSIDTHIYKNAGLTDQGYSGGLYGGTKN